MIKSKIDQQIKFEIKHFSTLQNDKTIKSQIQLKDRLSTKDSISQSNLVI